MGRARKPLSEQKGNLTVAQQQNIESAATLTDVGHDDFENVPNWVQGKTAKDEYRRLSKLLIRAEIAGDLDLNNLGIYCNAYGMYRELVKKSKHISPCKTLPSGTTVVNAEFVSLTAQIQKYTDMMLKYAGKLGLTIDSRLKAGTLKVSKINDEITDEFGNI